jgi:hypothetical protein
MLNEIEPTLSITRHVVKGIDHLSDVSAEALQVRLTMIGCGAIRWGILELPATLKPRPATAGVFH